MDLQLNDKVAVVTGASRGIGLAITAALSAEGARVVAGARSPGDELGDLQGVSVLAVDLATARGPADLVAHAVEEHGGIDILVNNVGGIAAPRLGGFLSVDDADWQTGFELNFFSAVRASRAALPHLVERRGSIVNVSSVNATLPDPSVVDYAAAKAAMASLSKTLSMEFAAQGVRINAVSPGPVLTTLWTGDGQLADQLATAMGTDRDGAMQGMMSGLGGVPLGRFSEPAEVASLVAFLASDRAGNVTGANYVIDGGLIKTT